MQSLYIYVYIYYTIIFFFLFLDHYDMLRYRDGGGGDLVKTKQHKKQKTKKRKNCDSRLYICRKIKPVLCTSRSKSKKKK